LKEEKMDPKLFELMNDQIKHELYSAYMYLAMSAYCEEENMPGFAAWLKVQASEEQQHAMKFYGYLLDRNQKVVLKGIDQPPATYTSLKEVFEKVYAHEQKVTALINAIYVKALEAKDVASQIFLQWFISEQVEEEKHSSSILDMVTKVGSSVGGLYQLDHQLGKRQAG
jgi:ferritin